jgi:CheY-specific phosphatase CheX
MVEIISDTTFLETATRILESMFFTTVSGDAVRPDPDQEMIGASVTFEGRVAGFLAIATDTETAKTLAADFLALESKDSVDPEQARQMIGELANMICGATLSGLDDEALFDLAHPVCGAEAVALALSGAGTHWFMDIGAGTLAVRLWIEGAA